MIDIIDPNLQDHRAGGVSLEVLDPKSGDFFTHLRVVVTQKEFCSFG